MGEARPDAPDAVLGHFAFTTALLPLMISTAKKADSDSFPRVVNVASVGHVFAPYVGIPFDNMSAPSPAIAWSTSTDRPLEGAWTVS